MICGLVPRVDPLITGFRVEKIGEGDYFGFELKGEDKKFLMGNFMVTHNSTILRNILRAYPGVHTVVLAPGKSLLKQTVAEMREHLPDREIKLMGGGSTVRFQSDDITVCSMDSVHLLDPGPVRLVVVDEPHAIVSEGRADHLPKFAYARKYAVGATLKGRYDGRDFLLEGLFGPVLANRTYREAVAEGAICPIKVVMVRKVIPREMGDRTKMMKKHVLESEWMARLCRRLSTELIPQDAQTLFFIKQEKQAELYQKYVGAHRDRHRAGLEHLVAGAEADVAAAWQALRAR
jgi:superfamily II DNA or RNA helicase